jgi:hypothetical protein
MDGKTIDAQAQGRSTARILEIFNKCSCASREGSRLRRPTVHEVEVIKKIDS